MVNIRSSIRNRFRKKSSKLIKVATDSQQPTKGPNSSPLNFEDVGAPWTSTFVETQKSPLISSASLCKLCEGITRRALWDGYPHHESGQQLLASQQSDTACPLCALIVQTLRKVFLLPNWDNEAKQLEFISKLEKDTCQIVLFLGTDETAHAIEIRHDTSLSWDKKPRYLEQRPKRYLHLYTRHDESTHYVSRPWLPSRHIPCNDPLDTMRLLRRWINDCLNNHYKCVEARDNWLPSRLVDVESSEDRGFEPYLWINPGSAPNHGSSELLAGRVRYAALSYCWGEKQTLTTSPSTLEARKHAIPMNLMPKTIRDAVLVARLLKIRYLWVDALCILQGSSDEAQRDWMIESGQMEKIYQSAFLTLGASYGYDADAGLLARPRKPKLPYCCLPNFLLDDTDGKPVYVGPAIGREPDEPPFELSRLEEEPLSKRAWTLQERVLSARMVFFGFDQLSWECKHGLQYEREDPAEDDDVSYYPKQRLKLPQTYRNWNTLVEDYSSRNLTFSTDRLVALAGVARAFSSINGKDEYLGGMWREALPGNLLWAFYDGRSTVLEPDQPNPCAPSWSWASVTQKTKFTWKRNNLMTWEEMQPEESDLEILETKTFTKDPFGPVMKAELVVRGFLKRGRMALSLHNTDRDYNLFDGNSPEHDPNVAIGTVHNDYSASSQEIADARAAGSWNCWPISLDVYCLLVNRNSGLLLRPVDSGGRKFRRVACFQLSYLGGHMNWFDSETERTTCTLV